MKSEEYLKEQLRSWIAKKNHQEIEVTNELNVIEAGVINSLDIMELILFVEQLKGEKFNLKNINHFLFHNTTFLFSSNQLRIL